MSIQTLEKWVRHGRHASKGRILKVSSDIQFRKDFRFSVSSETGCFHSFLFFAVPTVLIELQRLKEFTVKT